MKTPQENVEGSRNLNLVTYLFGKRIENAVDDPIIRLSLNTVVLTYGMAVWLTLFGWS